MALNRPLSRKLRLGMIGGGKGGYIGKVHRAAAMLDHHWELVAGTFSRTPETSVETARAWGIAEDRAYADYRIMIERERSDKLDAITICTTNETHYEIAKACLEAGFNVICEKPLTTYPEHAAELGELTRERNAVFAVCHCYSGYPMVRVAREMIACGELGQIRSVIVEYASQYGAETSYSMPWLDDPARSGPSGVVAGTGTHAHHLAEFMTGLRVDELSADLAALVEGHVLEDHATMHLRFDNGARGLLWNTSLAVGNENGLSIRVHGSLGSLKWRQEQPNRLEHAPLKKALRTLTRAGFETGAHGMDWVRVPYGHPEGYQEAYANLYVEIAQAILDRETPGSASRPYLFPTVEDGARGVAFVHAALASSKNNAAFVKVRSKVE
jgi:predicted dehydrogenase